MNGPGRSKAVAILPVGALGVAFYYHLSHQLQAQDPDLFFIERRGSQHAWTYHRSGTLAIASGTETPPLPMASIVRPSLPDCAESGLPAVVLVCTQSDQVLPVVTSFVELLERLFSVHGLEDAVAHLPLLVLCSNGIYHQRVRRFLVETLEESTLYGRLPDLWSRPMGAIVGKLLRGVTMQTGQRLGEGPEAVYHPGPPGLTRLAGGDPEERARGGELLQRRGGRFEVVQDHSATRVEFDKALVNLFANFLGQFKAIDEHGVFRPLCVREIFSGADQPDTRELARHVIAVGRAVHAYRPEEDFETIHHAAYDVMCGAWEHVPSSIKWIGDRLRAGTLPPHLTPTEKWLLEPLVQYASAAGLEESRAYFQDLIRRVEARLTLAIQRR